MLASPKLTLALAIAHLEYSAELASSSPDRRQCPFKGIQLIFNYSWNLVWSQASLQLDLFESGSQKHGLFILGKTGSKKSGEFQALF